MSIVRSMTVGPKLFGKYFVEKTDGSPVDQEAEYFVMRVDTDPAAREALRSYARAVMAVNPGLHDEIFAWLARSGQVGGRFAMNAKDLTDEELIAKGEKRARELRYEDAVHTLVRMVDVDDVSASQIEAAIQILRYLKETGK